MTNRSVYQFTVEKTDGEVQSLKDYENKVLLIVNTASQCGFTPQLKDLETLRQEFEGQDFEILAFPSDDFGGQEPLRGTALREFCELNFGTRFPVFEKVHIRGNDVHPLFRFLSDKKKNGKISSVPRWNFHKYLINHRGEVVNFFYPFTSPASSKIKKQIYKLLQEKAQ